MEIPRSVVSVAHTISPSPPLSLPPSLSPSLPPSLRMESDTRKQLLQLFDSRVVDVALRQFQDRRGNLTTEEIAGWILDHGTAVKLQIEHDAGAARQRQRGQQQQKREQALGGLDRVFHREKKAVDELASLVEDGLHSVEALAVLAQEIESLTRNIVERKRLNGKTEDDIMDDMLHRSMTSSSTGSTTGSTTPTGRAREIGRVLAPCARESYGVMSLSDAYRIYNRSRVGNLTEIATPDEFVGACRTVRAGTGTLSRPRALGSDRIETSTASYLPLPPPPLTPV